MTASPFFRLPIVIPGAAGLTIDSTKVSPLFDTSPANPNQPGQVSNLVATPGAGVVNLTWTPSTDGITAGYLVEARLSPNGSWRSLVWESTTPAATFEAEYLTAGALYDFRVTPYGPGGLGVASDLVESSPSFAPETGAAGHWVLGSDNPTDADLVSGQVLRRTLSATVDTGGSGYTTAAVSANDDSTWYALLTSGAVTSVHCISPGTGSGTPTLTITGNGTGATATAARGAASTRSAGYISIPGLVGGVYPNGLLTPIADATQQTVWGVFRHHSPARSALLFGTLAVESSSGAGFWQSASSGYIARHRNLPTRTLTPPAGLTTEGAWFFYVDVVDLLSGTSTGHRALFGGNVSAQVFNSTKVAALRHVALGNGHFAGTYADGLECAEFGIINAARTEAETQTLYARSKARMAVRGISVL